KLARFVSEGAGSGRAGRVVTRDTDSLPSASGDPSARVAADCCCRLCGGDVVFALRARDHARPHQGEHDYVACVECGSLQLERVPVAREPAGAATYYTHRQRLPTTRAGGWLGWRRVRARLVLRLGARGKG